METRKPNPQGMNRYLASARSIADAFGVYRQHVMPPGAHISQVIETRRAFFASADWVLKRLLSAVDDEADAENLMTELQNEIDDHTRRVAAGKA